ncbi:AraC family transcriptional regulator [Roseospira visakhapatnamensis]|uniref:AraC-like DNA-binding protein n=1 Tax=Roseospira visakhapatnamensis TaxID=390880 RepID=A0A7W6RG97_9PROT|nr:helix-turn-helix transcriptional regulator [Roseospira visakhapatnamensis]MBB4268030.1 AraC-like DNA-binding protein [Roseospira visakhapatnamensis]
MPDGDRLSAIERAESPVLLLPNRLPKGLRGVPHHHGRGQFIYPSKGRFRVHAAHQIWAGSPQQAMWIPPGVVHCVDALDDLDVHNVYVQTTEIEGLPETCKVLNVTPLMRELLMYGRTLSGEAWRRDENIRILLVITDLIRLADDLTSIHLPTSDDRRLSPILTLLMDQPDDNRGLEDWAAVTNTSARTLARLFVQHTGLTFGQWRQRLRIMEALTRLGDGQSVLAVSLDLGYSSQSAFTTMFRKVVGRPPSDFCRK